MAAKKTKRRKSKARAKRADTDGPHVKSLAEVGRLLKVGRCTPYRWQKHPNFPRNADGTYPVGKIGREFVDQMRSSAANRGDAPVLPDKGTGKHLSRERAEADLEFRKTKTERERVNLELTQGRLISRAEADQTRADLLADLRRKLLVVLPRRVAPRDKILQRKIQGEVRDFLNAFAGSDE